MKHSLPPLDSLKAFEAAARHLSFTLAAEELCLSKGAVSYHVRKLEEYIQTPIFKRRTRQVYLTEAGQILLKCSQQQFAQLSAVLATLNANQLIQPVSIGATTYVAARWLSSRIARFNQSHPDISVQILHSVNSPQFKLNDVDIEIRWCHCEEKPPPECLLQLPMPLYPVISPTLLARSNLSSQKSISISADFPGHGRPAVIM